MSDAIKINVENINSYLMKTIFSNDDIYNNEDEDGDQNFAIITSENHILTMKKLKKKAKYIGITGYSKLNKRQLLECIEENDIHPVEQCNYCQQLFYASSSNYDILMDAQYDDYDNSLTIIVECNNCKNKKKDKLRKIMQKTTQKIKQIFKDYNLNDQERREFYENEHYKEVIKEVIQEDYK